MGEPGWRVHLPTVDRTVVRLAVVPQPGMPWTGARALEALGAAGARRLGRPRAVGSGRGAPVLSSWELDWDGCECHLEVIEGAIVEVVLELPSWDELSARIADETRLWELVDVLAAGVDAGHGALGDGEALDLDPAVGVGERDRRRRRHIGLLLPEDAEGADDNAHGGSDVDEYLMLPRSQLRLLLR